MSPSKIVRRGAPIAAALIAIVVALPIASQAAPKGDKKLTATTGKATHLLATSALLTATITPAGVATSYYFQYGPTTAYGSQTPTVSVGSGTTKVKVGQTISGLIRGGSYHYRVVAMSSSGQSASGVDRVFTAGKPGTSDFGLPKNAEVLEGRPFVLSGTLSGADGTSRTLVLQATSFPYQEAFQAVGTPTVTDASGRFSFAVPSIRSNTEFRVIAMGTLPLISRTETVHAQVRVTLHVRASNVVGLVRLYGTVAPAAVGAPVLFQVHQSPKPGKGKPGSEGTAKFVEQFSTVVKKAGKTFSRFSLVVSVRSGGRYRAVVKLARSGPLVTGYSQTVVLRAHPIAVHKTAATTHGAAG
jgi:hypothetical protein